MSWMLEVAAYQESAGDTLGRLDTYRRLVRADDRELLALAGFARAALEARNAEAAFEVLGFGEALPMACDQVAWGQRINRRVEVWVR